MDHLPFLNSQQTPRHLDIAASEVAKALNRAHIRHGFIGGYAVSLLGETRTALDIDILVDAEQVQIRNILLETPSFHLSRTNGIVFKVDAEQDIDVVVGILRGGRTNQLKLPDAQSVPLYEISACDIGERFQGILIPIIHPSVLIFTKLRRWYFIAESIKKAASDFENIKTILNWLVRKKLHIDFAGYPEKPKEDLLPVFRALYSKSEVRPLLGITMDAQDLALIRD